MVGHKHFEHKGWSVNVVRLHLYELLDSIVTYLSLFESKQDYDIGKTRAFYIYYRANADWYDKGCRDKDELMQDSG